MSTPAAPGSRPPRPSPRVDGVSPPPRPIRDPATPTRAERIDLLARILPEVVRPPQGYQSEAGLAAMLGLDPRRLRAFRTAGIAGPRRLGRGFVYGEAEARTCAVAARLSQLGLTLSEIADFFEGPCAREVCPHGLGACTAADCCAFVLERLARRVADEIAELQRFGRLLAVRGDED